MRTPIPVRTALAVCALSLSGTPLAAQGRGAGSDADLVARARAIHERVITLDTHNGINVANFTAARNYTQRLTTQVNLPKMEDGGLDASFFIVYVGQDDDFTPVAYRRAHDEALTLFRAIRRLTDSIAPDRIGLATTAAEVRRIAASGRKVALIGVENGYSLGDERMARLDAQFPPPARATVADFVNHIDYAVKLIGIDHVGISSDFDGGGGVDGWNDASETFNVTLELVRRGYTEEQIGKLWSGNLLRVMDEVQAVALRLRR